MKVSKCDIDVICDTFGCEHKAEKQVYFNGQTVQLYMCTDCLKKLYETLKDEYCDKGVKLNEKIKADNK